MGNKRIILFFLPIALLLSIQFACAEKNNAKHVLSLQECISILLKNNLTLKDRHLTNEQIKLEVDRQRCFNRPQVQGDISFKDNYQVGSMIIPGETTPVSIGSNITSMATVNATQSIYDKRQHLQIEEQKQKVRLSEIKTSITTEDLIYQTGLLYFAINSTCEMEQVLKEQYQLQSSIMSETSARVHNGFALSTDLQQMQVELLDVKSKQASLEMEKIQLINKLKKNLNIDTSDTLVLSDNYKIESKKTLQYPDFYKLSTVQLLQQQKSIDSLNIRKTNALKSPTISLFANYGFQNISLELNDLISDKSCSDVGSVGIKLSIPIFTSGKINKEIAQHKLEFQKHEVEAKIAEEKTNYLNAKAKFYSNKKKLALSEKQKELSEEVLKVVDQRYKNGKVVITDLLKAQEDLLENRVRYTQKNYDLQSSILELLYCQGRIKEITL
ncbi:TolC family protein [Halosquirtibacter laminarini]|uniref:TolC family protein n=1 Tax=Halosquirtibacter laminarini TaxID=3374600 RepID=A0AC61NE67_9BACT|nr:TolC family protein [Prolixibacteraceae bacterium]